MPAPRTALSWTALTVVSLSAPLPPGALAAGGPPAPANPPAAAAPAAAAATVAPAASSHSALLQTADDLVREVATLRGLPAKTTVARGVLSREQIVEKLQARIAKEYTPEEVRRESGVLKRLGLLPEDMNYEKTLYELLADQVAGFYDPPTRTLFIADWLPIQMQRPALAHEIQHALQDQYFDLQKFSAPLKEEGDAQLARSAVVEGDGTAVMLELPTQGARPDSARAPAVIAKLGKQMMYLTMGATPAFQKAPLAMRETLVFPYAAGLEFVVTHRGDSGWGRVNELFRDPPDSTEQIMHPEKYSSRERPVRIVGAPLPSLVASGRKEVRRDVMGELLFKVWFSGMMPQSQAEAAAAGWGGDRLVAYEGPGDSKPIVLSLSAWDSDSDADEAEAACRRVLPDLVNPPPDPTKGDGKSGLRAPTSVTASPSKDARATTPTSGKSTKSAPLFLFRGNETYGLVRRGRLIALLLGVPRGSEGVVSEEIFSKFGINWPAIQNTPPSVLIAPPPPPAPAGSSGRPPGPWR